MGAPDSRGQNVSGCGSSSIQSIGRQASIQNADTGHLSGQVLMRGHQSPSAQATGAEC